MWRPLARRALLYRRTAAPKLRPFVDLQVITRSLSCIESESHLSLFSSISYIHQNPRFFSSSLSENHEDLHSEPLISEANENTVGFDFSGMNVFDGNKKSEFESEDSIFDDAIDNLEVNQGFGEHFDGSAALDDKLDSVAAEEEIVGEASLDDILDSVAAEEEFVGEVKKNDVEKVESLLSLLQSSGTVDGSIEPYLEGMDLVLDEDFVLKVLQTPYVPGENLISFFRWILKKPEFKLSKQVLDALVSAICKENRKREAYTMWDLINEVGEKEKGIVSTETLNELIAVFSRLGKAKAAFDVFNKFEEFECISNAETYYLTIEALCRRSFYQWACSICEKMLSAGKFPDAEKVGKIISYLCKGGMTKDAHLVYLYARDKKIHLSRSSINFLVTSLSRIEKTDKVEEINKELDRETVSLALEILNDYSPEERKYAIKSFSSVIKKLCWIEDVDRAKKLLHEMIESGPPPGNASFNCVINGLTKSGDVKEAVGIMKVMENRGLKPDVYTYSVIMSGYVRSGDIEEACKIFDEAKKKHSRLTPVTYHTLIRGFCKLEQFDEAVNLLGEMKEHGVQPSHDEYNKLIKSLCFKALDWESAEKLQEDMKVNGLILNGRTRALISAVKELQEGASTETPAPA